VTPRTPPPRTPKYVARFARLPRVLAMLDNHPDGLPITDLADAFGVSVEELREDLLTFYAADVTSDDLFGLARREVLDFVSPAGEQVDPNEAEVVRLTDPQPTEELGVEYVDAADLALLYTAARDLQRLGPVDPDLDAAVNVLRDTVLGTPEGSDSSSFRTFADRSPSTVLRLREAIEQGSPVRITYSRAWRPGVSTRVIEPYRLVRTRRGWEVDAGPVQDDGSIRTFLLSRVSSVEVLPGTFVRPDDVEHAIAGNRTTTTVRVRLPQGSRWAAERFAERVDTVQDDEQQITLDVDLLPPVEQRLGLLLLVAGHDSTVVDPPSMRPVGQSLARELLEHHRGADDSAHRRSNV
jgi:predicted DNA-binding transcriptional regulator YafY